MQNKPLFFFAFFSLSILVFSCSKDSYKDISFADQAGDYAFPLFTTDLNFKDLIVNVLDDNSPNDTLIFNQDNSITLIYSSEVASKKATELFVWLKEVAVPINDTLICTSLKAPDGVDFKQASLKSGDMFFWMWNTVIGDTVQGYVTIPQMVKDGQPFVYNFVLAPGPGPLPTHYSEHFDMAGYTLNSTNDSLCFQYKAWKKDGTPVVLPGYTPEAPAMVLWIKGMEFSYLEGYWGFQEYPLDLDTIDIDINQSNLRGDIKIKDPKVTFTVANSYGFPTRGKVKYLRFVAPNGDLLSLESPVIDTGGIDWDYPSFAEGEIGQTKYDAFTFDATNSNIAEIFNAQPVQMIYEIAGIANAQQDPDLVGFITDSSTVSFGVQVELLLEGSARDFGADQSLDLDFGDYANTDNGKIESIEFKLVTENQMPVSTALQVYFQDENGATLDSLFQGGLQKISEAADVDLQGFPTGTKRTETFIPMDAARFDHIKKAKKAFLKTGFTTSQTASGDDQYVKLLSNMNNKVKMGVRVKTKL